MKARSENLPISLDAERLILGSIITNPSLYTQAAGMLSEEDFGLAKHRLLFRRMGEIQDRGETIDRITLANELIRRGELESVDGLSYIASLDDGLPRLPSIDSYIGIVKDKSALRALIYSAQSTIDRAMSGQERPEEIIASAEAAMLRVGDSKARSGLGPMSAEEIIDTHEGGINALLDPSKQAPGIPTGYYKFDSMTGGLHGGDLIVLAARPSVGKTSLALNIADAVGVHRRRPVVIFSLEMSRESLLQRMVCARARIDGNRFKAGRMTPDERKRAFEALTLIRDSPIYIDDTDKLSMPELRARARRIQAKHGLGLAVVDYLQLMEPPKAENRNQEISIITRGMKMLAKQLDVPVLALSQLSRAVETRKGDHRPQLSDLRESGSIEQDADIVAFIFREEMYLKDREDLRGLAELIVAKQRNGDTGTVNLIYLHAQTKFENRAEDYEEKNLE